MLEEVFEQAGYGVRFEWGADAVKVLAPVCAVTIIVDVLSFTTTVDVAVGRGARVLPLPLSADADEVAEVAARAGAVPAVGRSKPGWSLSPASLIDLPASTTLALPSPNGAALSAQGAAHRSTVLAGSLRNAAAVARAAVRIAGDDPIAVIPSGERWGHVGAVRPSVEDYLGAALIAAHIEGVVGGGSPETHLAVAAVTAVAERIQALVTESVSGRELIARGFDRDVELAIDRDASSSVPVLDNGIYRSL